MMRAIYNALMKRGIWPTFIFNLAPQTFEWEPKFNKHLVSSGQGHLDSPRAGHIEAITFQRKTPIQRLIRRLWRIIIVLIVSLSAGGAR